MSRNQRFSRMAVSLGAVFVFCLSLLYLADSGSGATPEKSHTTFFLLSQIRQTPSAESAPATSPRVSDRIDNHADAALFVPETHDMTLTPAHPVERIPLPLEPESFVELEAPDQPEGELEVAPSATRPEGAPPVGRGYREVRALVTAYCPCARCCGRHANGRTSIGTTAWRPGMAADPRAVPYGTLVEVPGYGTYPIDDTGGAMRQSWRRRGVIHIDIRMTYHWQAREWGRRYMTIRIYDPE